jgi:hypothetical protein
MKKTQSLRLAESIDLRQKLRELGVDDTAANAKQFCHDMNEFVKHGTQATGIIPFSNVTLHYEFKLRGKSVIYSKKIVM